MVHCRGFLVLLDTRGVFESSIQVGIDLCGVGYCTENDCYVVSDYREDEVYAISADTKRLITLFMIRGTPNKVLSNHITRIWAIHSGSVRISVGQVTGIDNVNSCP